MPLFAGKIIANFAAQRRVAWNSPFVFWGTAALLLLFSSFVRYRGFLLSGVWADDLSYVAMMQPGDSWPFLLLRLQPDQQGGWPYRPTFMLYFGALRHLFGANWIAFHAAGILLHAAVTLLVAVFSYRMTQRRSLAVAAALLFFCLPGKSESFGWICAQSTVLAAFFCLLTLLSWLQWLATGRRRWFFGAAMSYVLALGAKQDAQSLTGALLALHWLLANQSAGKAYDAGSPIVREAIPAQRRRLPLFWVLPFLLILWANIVNARTGAFALRVQTAKVLEHPIERLRVVPRFFNQLSGFPGQNTICSTLVFICVLRIVWKMPQLRFLWIWFGLTLLPAPLGAGAHVLNSGRFLYLPAIPLCLFLVHAIAVFGQRKEACDILLLAPVFALLILHWLNISWDTLFIEPTVCLMVWLAIVALTTILWGTKRPGAGITVWSGLALLLSAYLAVRPFGAFWPETAIAVTIWTAWCDRGEARLARAILVGVVMAQTPITSLIFVVAMLLCSIFYSSHRYEVAKQ